MDPRDFTIATMPARFAELGERLALGRLARADVISLALQSGLEQPAAERVYRESEGLPLFVAELLAPGAQPESGGASLDVAGGGFEIVGVFVVKIVFANVNHRQLPELRQIHHLVERTLAERALSEEADRDPTVR